VALRTTSSNSSGSASSGSETGVRFVLQAPQRTVRTRLATSTRFFRPQDRHARIMAASRSTLPLSQLETLNLAGGGLRKIREELNHSRAFVVRGAIADERLQLADEAVTRRPAVFEDDAGFGF